MKFFCEPNWDIKCANAGKAEITAYQAEIDAAIRKITARHFGNQDQTFGWWQPQEVKPSVSTFTETEAYKTWSSGTKPEPFLTDELLEKAHSKSLVTQLTKAFAADQTSAAVAKRHQRLTKKHRALYEKPWTHPSVHSILEVPPERFCDHPFLPSPKPKLTKPGQAAPSPNHF